MCGDSIRAPGSNGFVLELMSLNRIRQSVLRFRKRRRRQDRPLESPLADTCDGLAWRPCLSCGDLGATSFRGGTHARNDRTLAIFYAAAEETATCRRHVFIRVAAATKLPQQHRRCRQHAACDATTTTTLSSDIRAKRNGGGRTQDEPSGYNNAARLERL